MVAVLRPGPYSTKAVVESLKFALKFTTTRKSHAMTASEIFKRWDFYGTEIP